MRRKSNLLVPGKFFEPNATVSVCEQSRPLDLEVWHCKTKRRMANLHLLILLAAAGP
jgi:hypothetical protein